MSLSPIFVYTYDTNCKVAFCLVYYLLFYKYMKEIHGCSLSEYCHQH